MTLLVPHASASVQSKQRAVQ